MWRPRSSLCQGGSQPKSEFMSMKEVATEFQVSYFWVSRNWQKTLHLSYYKLGKSKLFKRADVYAAIERTRVAPAKPVGRPKKIIGVVS